MVIGFDGSRSFVRERTGTENYSFELLKHLAKIDTQNSYLVYIRPGSIVKSKEWPGNFKFKVINFPKLWTQLGLALQTFKDPLDLLFVPAHTLPLLRRPKLKTVMTVHDLGSEYLPAMHQLKQRLYLGFITAFQLKSSSGLIAVSNSTKEDLVKKVGIKEEKIRVVYEGVNEEFTSLLSRKRSIIPRLMKKYHLKAEEYFLFVGTIQPRKNLERLIKAFSKLDNGELKLALVGSRGWLSEKIYGLPKKLKVEDKVTFLGRVPQDELPSLYLGAKGLVFPSLFEGFGLPIIEAFSLSCPVLTSNISSMREIAGDSAILADPFDIDSITSGMRDLLNGKKTGELVKKGLKRAQNFSWKSAANETLRVLEEYGEH